MERTRICCQLAPQCYMTNEEKDELLTVVEGVVY